MLQNKAVFGKWKLKLLAQNLCAEQFVSPLDNSKELIWLSFSLQDFCPIERLDPPWNHVAYKPWKLVVYALNAHARVNQNLVAPHKLVVHSLLHSLPVYPYEVVRLDAHHVYLVSALHSPHWELLVAVPTPSESRLHVYIFFVVVFFHVKDFTDQTTYWLVVVFLLHVLDGFIFQA